MIKNCQLCKKKIIPNAIEPTLWNYKNWHWSCLIKNKGKIN